MKDSASKPASPGIGYKIAFPLTFYFGTLLPEALPKSNHWNKICDGLILGALPIATSVLGYGNHAEKIINECNKDGRPLGAVYSVVNPFEIKGEGLGFLKPVSPECWKSKKVNHHLIPMDDFGGNIDLKQVKATVDDMHKQIESGRSVYVHCKAGKGRSFTFVVCYLLMHTNLNVTEIFALIRKQRPQVSPSNAQFETIEKFRQKYCPNKAPLNKDSLHFQSYRKDWSQYGRSPMLHAGIGGIAVRLIYGIPYFGYIAAVLTGLLSRAVQYVKRKIDENAYQDILKDKNKLSHLSLESLKAIQSGIQSGTTWKGWFSHLADMNATVHYQYYRGGMRLGQEKDSICKRVDNLIEKKSKLLKNR
jgi:hypothetical protein